MSNEVKTLGISLPEGLKAAGRRKAQLEGRSFSNYIRLLLQRDLNYAPPHQPAGKRDRKPLN